MHKSVVLFVCTLLLVVATTTISQNQDRTDCPNPFTKIGSKCYHFSSNSYTFDNARIFCQGLVDPVDGTADLAVLGFDYDDFYHVANYMDQAGLSSNFTVGLSDPYNEGNWKWLDGTPMSLSSVMWACDEPEMCPACVCAALFRDSLIPVDRIQLADIYCSSSYHALCQYGVSLQKEGL